MTVQHGAAGRVRRALHRHLASSESGVVFVIFALALIVLMGMVALGIDGSRLYDERRQAQNAADHAAIAASYASCTGADAAASEAAGLASAATNGYNNDGVTNDVVVSAVGAGGSHEFEARVDTTISATFGAVIGFASLDTGAQAVAMATDCDPTGGGVPAIHGGGDCSGYEKDIDISGENHAVNGLLHTNGDFYQSASKNTFLSATGPSVTYVGAFEGKQHNGNIYDLPEQQTTVQPWPTGFDPAVMTTAFWNLYRDSPHRVNTSSNTQTKINVTADGIYYSEASSEVVVETIAANAKFTIVSTRAPVRFPNTHNGVYHAYPNLPAGTPPNVMVVSGYDPGSSERCAKMAFLRSGNFGTWNGIFWGPKANVEWSGNSGTVNGGLVGYAIKLNGNGHTFNGGDGTIPAAPFVLLMQ